MIERDLFEVSENGGRVFVYFQLYLEQTDELLPSCSVGNTHSTGEVKVKHNKIVKILN